MLLCTQHGTSLPLGISNDLPWGEYRYCLELHNISCPSCFITTGLPKTRNPESGIRNLRPEILKHGRNDFSVDKEKSTIESIFFFLAKI